MIYFKVESNLEKYVFSESTIILCHTDTKYKQGHKMSCLT